MLQMDQPGADTGEANESKQDLASPLTIIWLHLSIFASCRVHRMVVASAWRE